MVLAMNSSCKKYLNEKPKQNLATPSTLSDLQALLDNGYSNGNSTCYSEFLADNYYLTASAWSGATIDDRLNYTWDKDAKLISRSSIWNAPYSAIYNANLVLDYLPNIKISASDSTSYKNIKGTALFCRAFMFYQLAQLFCKPFTSSAATDLGIVLRTTAAVEAASTRSTVQQTYDQIINDLTIASVFLPATTLFSTQPNNAAACGLLARVYLSMRDYENAGIYAGKALNLNNSLLNYNAITKIPGFKQNPEIQFLSRGGYGPIGLFDPAASRVDSNLYKTYGADDLRKQICFTVSAGAVSWQGSYTSEFIHVYDPFDGVANDEIYLVRAECLARAGSKDAAMADLNTLLKNRYKAGTFTGLTASDANDALNIILTERRKELVFRGLRWTDLRRFNVEGANITLKRDINGTVYTLPPNDLRWSILIPEVEINRSGIQQNPR
ncbi:hypothetical protein A4H97_20060 [Niastella yeongjuensis]|uniref:Carbohydrate-binding protein SusD n=2 Tax=Niastella yeongjuensis TaxID=354355 RepID=A0A1V9FC02_9BACT|nr:hypothetical protein A4H97_20060 [Niastella yeongjuensis]